MTITDYEPSEDLQKIMTQAESNDVCLFFALNWRFYEKMVFIQVESEDKEVKKHNYSSMYRKNSKFAQQLMSLKVKTTNGTYVRVDQSFSGEMLSALVSSDRWPLIVTSQPLSIYTRFMDDIGICYKNVATTYIRRLEQIRDGVGVPASSTYLQRQQAVTELYSLLHRVTEKYGIDAPESSLVVYKETVRTSFLPMSLGHKLCVTSDKHLINMPELYRSQSLIFNSGIWYKSTNSFWSQNSAMFGGHGLDALMKQYPMSLRSFFVDTLRVREKRSIRDMEGILLNSLNKYNMIMHQTSEHCTADRKKNMRAVIFSLYFELDRWLHQFHLTSSGRSAPLPSSSTTEEGYGGMEAASETYEWLQSMLMSKPVVLLRSGAAVPCSPQLLCDDIGDDEISSKLEQ